MISAQIQFELKKLKTTQKKIAKELGVSEIVVSKVKELPNDGVCRKYPGGYSQTNADYTVRYYPPAWIMIHVYSSSPPGVCCEFEIVANWKGAANRRIFTFKVCKQEEPAD